MTNARRRTLIVILMLCNVAMANACGVAKTSVASNEAPAVQTASPYSWTRVTESAAYPVGYNYPVFVANNRMWAFHNEGIWYSTDAKNWTKASLPHVRRNPYEARYVQFNNAIYALGQNQGNYINGIKFSSIVRRTTDFERWDVLAEKSNLPDRVFYGTVVFNGKIWLFGGFDGKDYYNDVWNSSDGVRWTRVSPRAAWSPRNVGMTIVFKNRIWIIGGGVIDGEPTNNPKSSDEIWSSADGINWTLETDNSRILTWGTPIVFDEKLWLVGANRGDGNFARSSLVTNDGVTWREESAPWSPRGFVAAWVFDNKLYITGGKYGGTANQTNFIRSNDVWRMTVVQSRPAQASEECEWCGANDAPPNLQAKMVIPPAGEAGEPLVISGTVFKADGRTPAEGVLLYVYHTNAAGIYPKRTPNDGRPQWRHGYLRGWMRTGRDGRYEFRTIKPAAYPARTEPAHIHLTMSAANHPEYSATIWFAADPLITPEVRASNNAIVATRTMRPAAILTLRRDAGGVLRGTHDIRLERVTS